jgi:SAM-dependent methyltransferase
MIAIAAGRADEMRQKIGFHVMDMLDIAGLGIFDLVLCFGNTLPHLPSEAVVGKFFALVNNHVADNGAFVFQILNYDKILSEGGVDFRVVETGAFVFRREYIFRDDGIIEFKIEFEDRRTGLVQSDTTDLLPLRRKGLFSLLEEAGFKAVQVYSDYDMTKSDLKEYASIYVARKAASPF